MTQESHSEPEQPPVGAERHNIQFGELEQKLREAAETIEALRRGHVDGIVVDGPHGSQVHTLHGPDEPFRLFVEAMHEGAFTAASSGCILYANTSFSALVDEPLDDIVGCDIGVFVAREFQSTCRELIEQGVRQPVKGTVRLIGPTGTIPVQLSLSPLPGGREPRCCAIVFDLRERELIEHANAAREAAEQANQAKDRFLAILSHELRSPLNTILGWAQILVGRTDLPENSRRAISAIERNARAQSQLISELLDISRVVTGKLHLELDVVDLTSIVESVVASTRMDLEKDLNVSCELPGSEVLVAADSTRLNQIVTNLVDNAVKFTDSGGSVSLRVRETGDHAELSVSDTGIGIAQDQLPYIFDLFRQGNAGTARAKGGLGLGMAIVKQLVEAHKGEIHVESRGLGRGTTVTLQIPTSAPDRRSEPHGFTSRRDLAGVRVLVVDDEPDTLELLHHLLEGEGAIVEAADSAVTALWLLDQASFDVLVSDLGLPEQDGFALMREVRARGRSATTLPAIALTGYADRDSAQLSSAAGFQLHLGKPIDARELVTAIARVAKTGA